MKTILFATAVSATSITGPAAAQTIGVRVEATTGYDVLTSTDIYTGADDVIPDTLRGLRIGLAAGYDLAIAPRVTLGVELGVGTTVSGKAASRYDGNVLELGAGGDVDFSVRAGFAVTPRSLIYAKVGYANSRSTAMLSERVGTGVDVTYYSDSGSGVRIGGGIEHALSGWLYLKAEYRWTRYGDDAIEYQSRTQRHQILLGLGTRF